MMPTYDLTPTAVMPTHDLTPAAVMPAHDPTPAAVMPAHDPVPAATLAGDTAMGAALADFQRRYPAYAGTAVLDGMRARDYTRLDATGHVYLDYTGGGLYAESQLARHQDLLAGAVFGNPHSQNVPSRGMGARVEATRAQILAFFRASPEEYEVIFTPNATGALRLVGESYPFGPGGHYLLTFDNHNSVNGIRQFARAKGASVTYVPLTRADLRVSEETLARHLQAAAPVRRRRFAHRRSGPAAGSLFAFPAQSNFSGVQHPLAWIAQAQDAGYDVLLDAAAFVPAQAGSVPVAPGLRGPVVLQDLRLPDRDRGPAGAQAGAGQAAPPVVRRRHDHLLLGPRPGGPRRGVLPHPRTGRLRGRHRRLPGHPGRRHRPGPHQLGRHRNHPHPGHLPDRLAAGRARRPAAQQRDTRRAHLRPGRHRPRGATIAMNFFDPGGTLIDSVRAERRANRAGISLRSGCHCNPGVREAALGFSTKEMAAAFKDKDRLGYQEFLHLIDGKTTGVARASLGLVTTFADVYRFWQFAGGFRNLPSHALGA